MAVWIQFSPPPFHSKRPLSAVTAKLMSGLVGRMFREFALTLTIAVVTSAIVSLTLTPMMCSRMLKHLNEEMAVPGLAMFAAQDIRAGGRQSDSDYQYTLTSTDLDLLQKWAPIVSKRMETVEGITDISADRDPGGLQLTLKIDRQKASALGVRVQDIDNALNNAFAQRQIAYIYTQRNQYMPRMLCLAAAYAWCIVSPQALVGFPNFPVVGSYLTL